MLHASERTRRWLRLYATFSDHQTALLLSVARRYGKISRTTGSRSSKRRDGDNAASKYKLRGKDDGWLSMREMHQGLFEIAMDLGRFKDYRAKWATFFLVLVDEDGKEVLIDPSGEKVLYPYKSAADEFGA